MQTSTGHAPDPTSPWIARWSCLVPPGGAVLDVACGSGRHLRRFLAAQHSVTGIDRDISGLSDLVGNPSVEAIRADLEDGSPWPLPGRRFSAVVVTNYLHRPLLPRLAGLLAPRGVLLYETFAVGNEKYGRPNNPDFLLRENELLDLARGSLGVVAYEAVDMTSPRQAVIQRIAAVGPG